MPTNHKLVVRDLHKSYGDHEVLKGVSLHAKVGDVISVIGSSGSGKSTALRIALGEMAVEVLGSQRVEPRALLRHGFVFRHPHLADIVAAGLRR